MLLLCLEDSRGSSRDRGWEFPHMVEGIAEANNALLVSHFFKQKLVYTRLVGKKTTQLSYKIQTEVKIAALTAGPSWDVVVLWDYPYSR